jgi:hypothetical protein
MKQQKLVLVMSVRHKETIWETFWHKTISVFLLILVMCRHEATRVGYGRVWAQNRKAQLGYHKGRSWSCVGTKQQNLVELHFFWYVLVMCRHGTNVFLVYLSCVQARNNRAQLG